MFLNDFSSMFPQYPPYSNRIYVNPKFNNGANAQQQQMLQKRQFIEMEAQRMMMLQQQIQLEQEKQRLAELDRKRREAADNLKKRKETKEHNVSKVIVSLTAYLNVSNIIGGR
jgi:tRNA uridine 5-carbamoylmethylation protein Kti12